MIVQFGALRGCRDKSLQEGVQSSERLAWRGSFAVRFDKHVAGARCRPERLSAQTIGRRARERAAQPPGRTTIPARSAMSDSSTTSYHAGAHNNCSRPVAGPSGDGLHAAIAGAAPGRAGHGPTPPYHRSAPRRKSHKRTPNLSSYPIYPNHVIMLRRETGWQPPCHHRYGP
jgi:hypothetical protein